MVGSGRKILLRGFGLPKRNSIEHSPVIIILEEVNLEQERGAPRRERRFDLLIGGALPGGVPSPDPEARDRRILPSP
jgi:hypothetical protein